MRSCYGLFCPKITPYSKVTESIISAPVLFY
uniref:Uncharacterized protein n=1 Tax=Arundo donax TaxID=35708 RepID=A0A0A9C3K8_ARUDO